MNNIGQKTVKNLSEVWTRFGQTDMLNNETKTRFKAYLAVRLWAVVIFQAWL